jgi:hypothetical protein
MKCGILPLSFLSFHWFNGSTRANLATLLRFQDHTKRQTIGCRTPLDEGSACRRHVYLTKRNTNEGQASMIPPPPSSAIPASYRSQTHALGRSAIGLGGARTLHALNAFMVVEVLCLTTYSVDL